MKAIGKHVVIKKSTETEKSASGLELTKDAAKLNRYKKGTIIAFGPDAPDLNEGDEILFDGSAGFQYTNESGTYTIIQHRDVAIVF